jgi:hypothetical protein
VAADGSGHHCPTRDSECLPGGRSAATAGTFHHGVLGNRVITRGPELYVAGDADATHMT